MEAAAAMRDGPKNCKVEEQWDKEIFHRDLKPANSESCNLEPHIARMITHRQQFS